MRAVATDKGCCLRRILVYQVSGDGKEANGPPASHQPVPGHAARPQHEGGRGGSLGTVRRRLGRRLPLRRRGLGHFIGGNPGHQAELRVIKIVQLVVEDAP